MEAVYSFYAGLAQDMDADTGLGGKLLYCGEPDAAGSNLLRAANIAGAASLAASADAAALRRAMHEGALDFVVTSLDEALRILKNEIRQKRPAAVGVTLAPEPLLDEMVERGVQPDLLPPEQAEMPVPRQFGDFIARGARTVEAQHLPEGKSYNILPIPADWKQPASAFDALLLDCVAPEDFVDRRWVRLSPRYLPAACRRMRLVVCDVAMVLGLMVRIGGNGS